MRNSDQSLLRHSQIRARLEAERERLGDDVPQAKALQLDADDGTHTAALTTNTEDALRPSDYR